MMLCSDYARWRADQLIRLGLEAQEGPMGVRLWSSDHKHFFLRNGYEDLSHGYGTECRELG